MDNYKKEKNINEAKALILEAEMKISELEPELVKILSFNIADIKELQKMRKVPAKVIDICIGINWIIMPVDQKGQFGDWVYNQKIMKNNKDYEKSLNEAMEDFKLNTEQCILTNPKQKIRLDELDIIFEKHLEDPDFTIDGIKKVI